MVDKVSQSQYIDQLSGALELLSDVDAGFGPVYALFEAIGAVLADQNNNRLRQVYLLLALINEGSFSDSDINALLDNENLKRPEGTQAYVTATFYRTQPLAAGETLTIPVGFPVTTPGRSPTFITTEARTETDLLFNADTNRYEITVPMLALISGTDGRVGKNRVTVPLRGLVGFDGVTNTTAASGGEARYTNTQAIALYRLAVSSRQLSVPTGHKFYILNKFPAVTDVVEVFGTSEYLQRQEPGAVDTYIKGSAAATNVDSLIYPGVGQVIQVSKSPILSVGSVLSGVTTYVAGTDYEVVQDTSGYGGSVHARDGIRFLPTATTSLPALGDTITVTYDTNQLIRDLQSLEGTEDVAVEGRDLLYRQGTQVSIAVECTLVTRERFSSASVRVLVQNVIVTYINSLGLGDAVQLSDIQGEVRSKISGVDNLIITRMSRSTSTGAADIALLPSEYPATSPILVTLSG